MPMHDRPRLEAGTFQDFQRRWIVPITDSLDERAVGIGPYGPPALDPCGVQVRCDVSRRWQEVVAV